VLLVDAVWRGQPRKLVLQANRNGFLYVLDRANGKMLMATPLVKKLTWAKEIAPDGFADERGRADLPGCGRRGEFFLHLVQPRYEAFLCEHT